MFQVYVLSVSYVSGVCCKCFIWMFQKEILAGAHVAIACCCCCVGHSMFQKYAAVDATWVVLRACRLLVLIMLWACERAIFPQAHDKGGSEQARVVPTAWVSEPFVPAGT